MDRFWASNILRSIPLWSNMTWLVDSMFAPNYVCSSSVCMNVTWQRIHLSYMHHEKISHLAIWNSNTDIYPVIMIITPMGRYFHIQDSNFIVPQSSRFSTLFKALTYQLSGGLMYQISSRDIHRESMRNHEVDSRLEWGMEQGFEAITMERIILMYMLRFPPDRSDAVDITLLDAVCLNPGL